MHAVLRLFETEQAPAPGVRLHDREGKKPQRAVGQCTRDVLRVLEIRHDDAQELSLLVNVDSHPAHVLHEFGEFVRNARIDVPVAAWMMPLRRLRQVVQRCRNVGSIWTDIARRGESVRGAERRRIQLNRSP